MVSPMIVVDSYGMIHIYINIYNSDDMKKMKMQKIDFRIIQWPHTGAYQ